MKHPHIDKTTLSIIGLGYVGLPLALRLAAEFNVIGFDIDGSRIVELQNGFDRTLECSAEDLETSLLRLASDIADIQGTDVYIITVPTPVTDEKEPDLEALMSACQIVGQAMHRNAVVVFESTVYPGVTETVCGPALEKASGLVCGKDFFLGYSPERINPGDKIHTVDKITKVVAGQNADVAAYLMGIYGKLTNGNVFLAKDIKTAEAAKVIENAQRDINIAFINEVAMIFNQMGIKTHDVLEAAGTKWNFLNFTPGLVGGHCIGVDPYYLAHASGQLGHNPEIILAGRKINDGMAGFLAGQISQNIKKRPDDAAAGRVLALGLTFKENVPDLRNSKAADLVMSLQSLGYQVDVYDPLAVPEEAKRTYGFELLPDMVTVEPYDCVIGVVPHDVFQSIDAGALQRLLVPGGLVADLKGIWRHLELPESIARWEL